MSEPETGNVAVVPDTSGQCQTLPAFNQIAAAVADVEPVYEEYIARGDFTRQEIEAKECSA